MKNYILLVAIALFTIFSGCVPSLHSLYTEADLTFDQALVGQWSEKDKKETWTFTKSKAKEYQLVYVDKKGEKGTFKVHLVEIEGVRFLDLYPEDPGLAENGFFKWHLFGAHTFMQVKQIKPALQLAPLNYDWLKKYLVKHPDAIQHEVQDNRILLTAQTKALQTFVIKHKETKDAFMTLGEMKRAAD